MLRILREYRMAVRHYRLTIRPGVMSVDGSDARLNICVRAEKVVRIILILQRDQSRSIFPQRGTAEASSIHGRYPG